MQKARTAILLLLLGALQCSDMFKDMELYSGDDFKMHIYAASMTAQYFYILDETGTVKYFRDYSYGPPNLSNWAVNKYNELILVEYDGSTYNVLIKRPGEEPRVVGVGFDSVDAIAPTSNGSFYFLVTQAALQHLYVLPYGSNEMQLRTSDLNSLGISTVTRSWALQLNGKEMLYLFDSNNYSLYLSTDGGNSYQLVYNLGAGNQLLSMVSYQGYIYVSTSYNNVLYSIDGTSFALHSFLNGIVLNGFAIDRNKKLFAFSAAYIYFSLDGINWQQTMHYLTNALDLAYPSN